MIVSKTSVFPADRETIFEKIRKLDTLQYIAKPYATFEPVENLTDTWETGSTSSYRFKLFGIIPFGIHTIHIICFDPERISSREGNAHVPVWNHDIKMEIMDNSHTKYTDRVEIEAGWKTVLIWRW